MKDFTAVGRGNFDNESVEAMTTPQMTVVKAVAEYIKSFKTLPDRVTDENGKTVWVGRWTARSDEE